MKLILEEAQFERIVKKLVESSGNRSLLSLRKAGIGSIFPRNAMLNNPNRFRPYEQQRAGIEQMDLEQTVPEDNSDLQF